jgi:hypothetical protein
MTLEEFKRTVGENVKEALTILEGPDYKDALPANPDLEDFYVVFFTIWNDNIGEVVFET